MFLFFGVVAVDRLVLRPAGAAHAGRRSRSAVPVGLLAAAILVVNNVRDIDTDRRAGKRTLAVRLGRERTRPMYAAMVYRARSCCAVGLAARQLAVAAAAAARAPARRAAVRTVRTRTDGPSLNGALARTGALQLAFCVLLVRRDPAAADARRDPRGACMTRARAAAGRVGRAARARTCSCSSSRAPDGIVGYGEAAPLEHYDGVGRRRGARRAGGARAASLRERRHPSRRMALLEACRRARRPAPGARRVDMALWDRAARAQGLPCRRLIAARPARRGAGQRDDRRRGPRRRRRRGGRTRRGRRATRA